jgi:thiol-disulfide isomerase/thioredoxin
MIGLLSVLLGAAIAGAPPADPIGPLRQAIWSACDELPSMPPDQPPPARWIAACDAQREPVIRQLWQIGHTGDPPARIQALGLVAAWAPPQRAQAALDRLIRSNRNKAALAPALEAAFAETRAPARRATLARLITNTRSPAVAGAATYLLAADTLTRSGAPAAERRQAKASLHRVITRYGALPTTLLGAGDPPRLGRAAAALLFRIERLRAGQPLPPMSAEDLDGHPVSSASMRGKVTLIDFWATWCPPCVAAMPALRQLQATNARRNFQIVSISGDADRATAKAFARRNGNHWPQWRVGPSGTVSPQWSNSTFPYYILVNAAGRIVAADGNLPTVVARLPATLEGE